MKFLSQSCALGLSVFMLTAQCWGTSITFSYLKNTDLPDEPPSITLTKFVHPGVPYLRSCGIDQIELKPGSSEQRSVKDDISCSALSFSIKTDDGADNVIIVLDPNNRIIELPELTKKFEPTFWAHKREKKTGIGLGWGTIEIVPLSPIIGGKKSPTRFWKVSIAREQRSLFARFFELFE